jgi:hypothetical protein
MEKIHENLAPTLSNSNDASESLKLEFVDPVDVHCAPKTTPKTS